jgi:hypothetical protein
LWADKSADGKADSRTGGTGFVPEPVASPPLPHLQLQVAGGGFLVCFSPQADFVAGIVVGGIGFDVLRHVRRPAEKPLAAIPLVLAGHQLIEAFVWLGLQGRVPDDVWRPAMWLYLAIAFAVVPVLVPLAVRALEPAPNQRRIAAFAVLGAIVAVVLMHAVVRGPVDASIEGHHIAYHVELWHGGDVVGLYVVATCGSLLASNYNYARWFGAVNLVAVCLLFWLDVSGFISLWCLWAALTSIAIDAHLRHAHQPPRPGVTIAAAW